MTAKTMSRKGWKHSDHSLNCLDRMCSIVHLLETQKLRLCELARELGIAEKTARRYVEVISRRLCVVQNWENLGRGWRVYYWVDTKKSLMGVVGKRVMVEGENREEKQRVHTA